MNENLSQWIQVFMPILGIGFGIVIAIALLDKVGDAITKTFGDVPKGKSWLQHQNDLELKALKKLSTELFDDEKPKRQYVETDNWQDDEKPKRHSEPEYILGDDGELLEVIDDKPKRGSKHE